MSEALNWIARTCTCSSQSSYIASQNSIANTHFLPAGSKELQKRGEKQSNDVCVCVRTYIYMIVYETRSPMNSVHPYMSSQIP